MKRTILALILIILSSNTIVSQNKYVVGFNLNFRSTPAIQKNNIIGVIEHGKAVTEIEKVDSVWSKIAYNKKIGYVASRYLSDYKPTIRNQKKNSSHKKQETTVLICVSKTAYAYHRYRCRGLGRCTHSISKVSLNQAKRQGRRACKVCY